MSSTTTIATTTFVAMSPGGSVPVPAAPEAEGRQDAGGGQEEQQGADRRAGGALAVGAERAGEARQGRRAVEDLDGVARRHRDGVGDVAPGPAATPAALHLDLHEV